MVQLVALYAFYRVQQLVQPTATVHLSGREREALSWIAVGKWAADVGEILNISDRTVEWHIRMAMRKLGASNRIQTVVLALRDGLITL
jgi:DNA-binding CsgD family transcriptional regulator